MSRCHRSHSSQTGSCGYADGRPGVIRRVTQALADKIGAPRKLIVVAFIIAAISSLPLALLAFGVAWYWTDNPGAIERTVDRAGMAIKKAFRPASSTKAYGAAYGPASGAGGSRDSAAEAEAAYRPIDPDDEFADLRRQFDDLEKRAETMERHVTSEEYDLNRKFRDMGRGGSPA